MDYLKVLIFCYIHIILALVNSQNYTNDTISTCNEGTSIVFCPAGFRCSGGNPIPCEAGSYNFIAGSNLCNSCPEGWYCPGTGTNYVEESKYLQEKWLRPCSSSSKYFCPAGSSRPLPVAEGFYAINSHHSFGGGYGNQLECPPGSYCIDGVRWPCPAGRYGNRRRLELDSTCTGPCSSGYYCPEGSISSRQFPCQNASVFCPPGSGLPHPVGVGYYTFGFNSSIPVAGLAVGDGWISGTGEKHVTQSICDVGHYCAADGLRRPCPAGRYGSVTGLSSPQCSGFCSLGYYCPSGSATATQVECGGSSFFCPPGSAVPQAVQTGYYSVLGSSPTTRGGERPCEPGYYCADDAVKRACPPGYWGGTFALSAANCSGLCTEGYYCPLGSASAFEVMCGDPGRYCPPGVGKPVDVDTGFYSTGGNYSTRSKQAAANPGNYAIDGLLFPCPAGFYGSEGLLSSASCSGPCNVPGYYCPVGSTSPFFRVCGGDAVFCPAGTVAPIKVGSGFYTADYSDYEVNSTTLATLTPCPPGQYRNFSEHIFPSASSSSPASAIQAVPPCRLCPVHTYKPVAGDSIQSCRRCPAKYASSSDDRVLCSCSDSLVADVDKQVKVAFFDISTGSCKLVTSAVLQTLTDDIWSTIRNQPSPNPNFNFNSDSALTRYREFPCEPGYYCLNGVRVKCPGGAFGSLGQETRPLCAGLCAAGYYCPLGSTSPYQYLCGGPDRFCPVGSGLPRPVSDGFYTNEDDRTGRMRSSQTICPPGYYCRGGLRFPCPAGTYTDKEGTTSEQCAGSCKRGYYCLEASNSITQFPCGGSGFYCKEGSALPSPAHEGFYTATSGPDAGAQAYWDPFNTTNSVELPCEPGYYCSKGIKYPCPPGTFGWRYGMHSAVCGGKCAAGYYCPSYLPPQSIAPTYTVWPGKPQTSATAYECGLVAYYCPAGSSYPVRVTGGYYSVGGGNSQGNLTRTSQTICPAGSYCANAIPYLCPAGTFGATPGLSVSKCTGSCPAGFYCPAGSVEPLACGQGQYSTGAAALCSQCPGTPSDNMSCHFEKECCFHS